jgi:hypothetical protein
VNGGEIVLVGTYPVSFENAKGEIDTAPARLDVALHRGDIALMLYRDHYEHSRTWLDTGSAIQLAADLTSMLLAPAPILPRDQMRPCANCGRPITVIATDPDAEDWHCAECCDRCAP